MNFFTLIIAALFFKLVAAEFCRDSDAGCSGFDDLVFPEHMLSFRCIGANYTIEYNIEGGELEKVELYILCEPDCSVLWYRELLVSTSFITGSINQTNMTKCTVVGCYQRNNHGTGFESYSFNSSTCILNEFSDVEESSTTMINITSTTKETVVMDDADEILILGQTDVNYAIIISMVILLTIAGIATVISFIIWCYMKSQRRNSTKYYSVNVITDEIDLHFQPIKIELSMIYSESMPSIYLSLQQQSLSAINIGLSEHQSEYEVNNYYKPIVRANSGLSSSHNNSFDYDGESLEYTRNTEEHASLRDEPLSEHYNISDSQMRMNSHRNSIFLDRCCISTDNLDVQDTSGYYEPTSQSPSVHDYSSVTFKYDESPRSNAITLAAENEIEPCDYYKSAIQPLSLSPSPNPSLDDFKGIRFNFDMCDNDSLKNTENSQEELFYDCHIHDGCMKNTSNSDTPITVTDASEYIDVTLDMEMCDSIRPDQLSITLNKDLLTSITTDECNVFSDSDSEISCSTQHFSSTRINQIDKNEDGYITEDPALLSSKLGANSGRKMDCIADHHGILEDRECLSPLSLYSPLPLSQCNTNHSMSMSKEDSDCTLCKMCSGYVTSEVTEYYDSNKISSYAPDFLSRITKF